MATTQLASTSRVQLRYIKETDFGVTPTNGPASELRMTGESLVFNVTKESSSEINAYRGVSSAVPTNAEASGSINGEMQYAEYDPLIEGVLQDTWKPYGTNGASAALDLSFTANTIESATPTAGVDSFLTLAPGQWFTLSNTGTANDGKMFRVSKVTPPTATVITLDVNTPAVVGSGATSKLSVSRLTNGTTQPSFTLEKEMSDVGEFMAFRGMTPSSMNLSITSGAMSTIEIAFMGKDAKPGNATALPTDVPVKPSQGFQVMSGVAGKTCGLWVDGVPLSETFVTSIGLSYDNALRAQGAICALGAVGIGSGSIALTVDLEVYFASGRTFYDEFITNKNVEIAFTAFDAEGNGYMFTMPVANISSYTSSASAKDQDLMASIQLTGLMDLTTTNPALRGKVLFIDRIGVPVV